MQPLDGYSFGSSHLALRDCSAHPSGQGAEQTKASSPLCSHPPRLLLLCDINKKIRDPDDRNDTRLSVDYVALHPQTYIYYPDAVLPVHIVSSDEATAKSTS